MRQGWIVRTAFLCSIAVAMVVGQGVAIAAEGSASVDDPTDTVTDTADDPTDTVTDTADDPTDAVDDASDTVTDVVEGATGGAADDPIDPVVGGADNITSGSGDPSGGTLEAASGAAPRTTSSFVPPTALRLPGGSPRAGAFASDSDDLDDLAAGGNDVGDRSPDSVCVGTADVVCHELVGGGEFGILFRAAEETRRVASAFVDRLARTGIDLVGLMVLLVALVVTGIVLTSRGRRPGTTPSGSKGTPTRT